MNVSGRSETLRRAIGRIDRSTPRGRRLRVGSYVRSSVGFRMRRPTPASPVMKRTAARLPLGEPLGFAVQSLAAKCVRLKETRQHRLCRARPRLRARLRLRGKGLLATEMRYGIAAEALHVIGGDVFHEFCIFHCTLTHRHREVPWDPESRFLFGCSALALQLDTNPTLFLPARFVEH